MGACMIIGGYLIMYGILFSGMSLVGGWPPTCLDGHGGPSRGLKGGVVSLLEVDSIDVAGRR